MTQVDTPNTVRYFKRIILTLSLGSKENQTWAIEHTAHLADELASDVAYLCVRDSDLLHYSALPFAREFSVHGAQPRPLNAVTVRNEMDHRALSIQRFLHKLTTDQRQQSTFNIVDGRIDQMAMETVEKNDLLVMMLASAGRTAIGTAYENLCKIIEHSHCDLLLLTSRQYTRSGPVVLLVKDTLPSKRSLHLAIHMAQRRQLNLEILIDDDSALADTTRSLCDEVPVPQGNTAPRISMHPLSRCFSRPWQPHSCSMVIKDFDTNLPSLEFLTQSLNVFQAPMLLLQDREA